MPFRSLKIAQKLARNAAGRHPVPEVTVVAGAAASTNMAITGIDMMDELLSVLAFIDAAGILVDDTANASITSAGNIQSTTNNTGKTMLVFWYHVRTP